MRKHITLACVTALLAGTVLSAVTAYRADAQTAAPQILMAWQADSYVPDGFRGKTLPTSDSRITVGLDLIDLGRRVDLSSYKILWYIDNSFYQGAAGLTRINLTAPHFIGRTAIAVRASISDYPGSPGKTIAIPVVPPQAVIQSSAPSLAASAVPFSLQVYPYFFNVKSQSELDFSWKLNGTNVSNQNPFVVTREMAERRSSRVELSVSNPARVIERLTRELTILK